MRRIIIPNEYPSLDPLLSFSLFCACMAAIMAVISGLYGGRSREKPSSSGSSSSSGKEEGNSRTNNEENPRSASTLHPSEEEKTTTKTENNTSDEDDPSEAKELSLPPAMFKNPSPLPEDSSIPRRIRKSASTKNIASLKTSLSVKLKRTWSTVKEIDNKKKSKEKPEDSVWMKTIILGEKCRVPDGEEDQHIMFGDGKGTKIPAFYPRSTSSLLLPRSNSFAEISGEGSPKAEENSRAK